MRPAPTSPPPDVANAIPAILILAPGHAGDVVGTPAYIAPEQVRGGKLSPATDVYALATMLYELLASVFPFSIETEGEDLALLFKHTYEKPVPARG